MSRACLFNALIWLNPSTNTPMFFTILSYSLVYINVYHLLLWKFSPDCKKKSPHWEKTSLFQTQPVSWIPDCPFPQMKQNTALSPEFFRSCTVRVRGESTAVRCAPLVFNIFVEKENSIKYWKLMHETALFWYPPEIVGKPLGHVIKQRLEDW